MLTIINQLRVPKMILRHIMMNYLDLDSITTIILNVMEMNVLNESDKRFLSDAKRGLFWNCEHGNLAVVQYLVELGNSHGLSPNSTCRYSDKVELGNSHELSPNSTCRYADKVSVGADIHACDNAAVRMASKNGHLSIVQYLVSIGANIHAYKDEAIRMACYNGHLSTVQYL